MKCAIHQPQFMPWLGYLSKIESVDVFVFLDNVQYHKNEFQNRNRILSAQGPQWFTVPVQYKFGMHIKDLPVSDDKTWQKKLWNSLKFAYARSSHFDEYAEELQELLLTPWHTLDEINRASITWLMDKLSITTPIRICSEMPAFDEGRTRRLVEICQHVGADVYLSGSLAKRYLDVALFEKEGIQVEFQEFDHPGYTQFNSKDEFVSHLSALDALFNCGGGEPVKKMLGL